MLILVVLYLRQSIQHQERLNKDLVQQEIDHLLLALGKLSKVVIQIVIQQNHKLKGNQESEVQVQQAVEVIRTVQIKQTMQFQQALILIAVPLLARTLKYNLGLEFLNKEWDIK